MYGDSIFRYRDGICVAQIITFSVSFIFAGSFYYTRRIGWFCIGVFSIIRLVSASCYLAIMKNDSDSLWATVFVCESLGIMLIIFLFLELLHRVYVIFRFLIHGIVLIEKQEQDCPCSAQTLLLCSASANLDRYHHLYCWIHCHQEQR